MKSIITALVPGLIHLSSKSLCNTHLASHWFIVLVSNSVFARYLSCSGKSMIYPDPGYHEKRPHVYNVAPSESLQKYLLYYTHGYLHPYKMWNYNKISKILEFSRKFLVLYINIKSGFGTGKRNKSPIENLGWLFQYQYLQQLCWFDQLNKA